MSQLHKPPFYEWLSTGDEVFPAMLAAIDSAQKTIRCETYIYSDDELGRRFREALVNARRRGVRVSVLIDALGSFLLPADFWEPLVAAGGEARWFNPLVLKRFNFRDHRKMLVCDEETAFVGGFNVSNEYQGDGVKSGWRDLGLKVTGPLAAQLAAAFDDLFAHADFQHRRFMRLRKARAEGNITTSEGELLLSGPGRGRNPFLRALRKDLAQARTVQIIAAYFLPTLRLRRDLMRVVRRGGRVQVILPGKSDVLISQLAGRSLYRRLLRAGVEIYEYQPQILHAKLIIVDDTVYAGSSNLDQRSLVINYELMLRFQNSAMAADARVCFQQCLAQSRQIEFAAWCKSRTWWRRLKHRWAYFVLVHVDPFVARWQYKRIPP